MSWRVQELELEQIALWPLGAKLLLLVLVSGLLWLSGGYFFIAEPWDLWRQGLQQEAELKLTFKHKAMLAASLVDYQQQVAAQERQVSIALTQLPKLRHGAQLLGELSGLARQHGLQLTGFKWQAERPLIPATELPLQLTLVGDYHHLGQFVAQVSNLPRLVIIHGFELRRSAPANEHSAAVVSKAVVDKALVDKTAVDNTVPDNTVLNKTVLDKEARPLQMSVAASAYLLADDEEEVGDELPSPP